MQLAVGSSLLLFARRSLYKASAQGWNGTSSGLMSLAMLPTQPAADLILTNGKIVTVDERFTIAQAVAIKGDRIIAVGTNNDIARLAGPAARRIDLGGRSVIPGLIDNHMHLLRAGATWQTEVR